MPRRALPWLVLGVVALAWGYHDLLSSYFLRDDFMWLFDAETQLARPIEFLTTRPSGYFRPFANMIFGLERVAFGLDPRGYFVVNILLHGWNALWLAILVRAFGGSFRFAGAAGLIAVSLTAAAPGVVWISGLVSVLAVAMILPALFFYHAGLLDGRRGDFALSLMCVVLAVCSRESGVLAGLGILVLEVRHAHGRVWTLVKSRGFWTRLLPFAVAGSVYVALQLNFLQVGAGTRTELGSPLAYVGNVVTSLPALLRPEKWRLWFSLPGGLAVLLGAALLLGVFRGRRGLVLCATLFGLLLFAFLPTYPLLSDSVVMANRYRYEASFVAALIVAAGFDALFAGPRFARPLAWLGVRRALAGAALIVFTTAQLEALPRFVQDDTRFAAYADATRLMSEQLEQHFGEQLRAAHQDPVLGDVKIALVGVPVENLRHLRCQLGVWYEVPFERVNDVRFDLTDAGVRQKLATQRAGLVKEVTGCDEVWVWSSAGLVRAAAPLPAMRKNWRRPGQKAERSFVQVLTLPRLEAR